MMTFDEAVVLHLRRMLPSLVDGTVSDIHLTHEDGYETEETGTYWPEHTLVRYSLCTAPSWFARSWNWRFRTASGNVRRAWQTSRRPRSVSMPAAGAALHLGDVHAVVGRHGPLNTGSGHG